MAFTAGISGDGQSPTNTSEEQFYSPGTTDRPCEVLSVRAEVHPCIIRIPELHGASGGWRMKVGDVKEFIVKGIGISAAYCTADNALLELDWAPTGVGRAQP